VLYHFISFSKVVTVNRDVNHCSYAGLSRISLVIALPNGKLSFESEMFSMAFASGFPAAASWETITLTGLSRALLVDRVRCAFHSSIEREGLQGDVIHHDVHSVVNRLTIAVRLLLKK
jgi:hypothetical protein